MTAKGGHPSPETREKLRASMLGKVLSPEHRRKISEATRGQNNPFWGKHHNPGAREKMRAAKLGKPLSEETRAKMSKARRGEKAQWFGKHLSPETREKLRAAKLGKSPSPETRRKMSEAHRGENNPAKRPESKKKISESKRGEKNPQWRGGTSFWPYCQKFTPEFRERVRAFWEYQCALCGKTQAENGRKLAVHHVNYRKDACCNEDAPRYFVPLCHQCHSKTGHNRKKWERELTTLIEKKYSGKCYFHQKEMLAAWGAV